MGSKWKYKDGHDDHEDLEKVGKMRGKSRKSHSRKDDVSEQFILAEAEWPKTDDGFAGRVVEVHKRHAFISPENSDGIIETNKVWMAKIAGKYLTADRTERNFVVVGDRVWCRPSEGKDVEPNSDLDQATMFHMAPRKSQIVRVDPMYEQRVHVLAANMDRLLIVSSFLSPRVKWGLIDRYLVLSELENLEAIIILNKADLLEEKKESHPDFYQECHERRDYYRSLGYDVFVFQANKKNAVKDPEILRLGKLIHNSISLFSGHSGVGKSSICNVFAPEIIQDVEPDSDIFYKGRHTTSFASFLKLAKGGYVIDTPGIRSFVLQDFTAIQLTHGFREFRAPARACKFRECRHIEEPECHVLDAVKSGLIPEWRYNNYKGILLGTTGREGRVRGESIIEEGEVEE